MKLETIESSYKYEKKVFLKKLMKLRLWEAKRVINNKKGKGDQSSTIFLEEYLILANVGHDKKILQLSKILFKTDELTIEEVGQ